MVSGASPLVPRSILGHRLLDCAFSPVSCPHPALAGALTVVLPFSFLSCRSTLVHKGALCCDCSPFALQLQISYIYFSVASQTQSHSFKRFQHMWYRAADFHCGQSHSPPTAIVSDAWDWWSQFRGCPLLEWRIPVHRPDYPKPYSCCTCLLVHLLLRQRVTIHLVVWNFSSLVTEWRVRRTSCGSCTRSSQSSASRRPPCQGLTSPVLPLAVADDLPLEGRKSSLFSLLAAPPRSSSLAGAVRRF